MDLTNYLENYFLSKNNSRDLDNFNHLILKLQNFDKNKLKTNLINVLKQIKSLYNLELDISYNTVYKHKNSNLEIHKKKIINNLDINMLSKCILDNEELYKKDVYKKGLLNYDPNYEQNIKYIFKNNIKYNQVKKINNYHNILFEESYEQHQFEKEIEINNIHKDNYNLKRQTNFYKDYTISNFNINNNINNDDFIKFNFIEYSFNINNIKNNYFSNNIFIREYFNANTLENQNSDLYTNLSNNNLNKDINTFLNLFKTKKTKNYNKQNINSLYNLQIGINLDLTENNNIIESKLNDIIRYTNDLNIILDDLEIL